MTSFQEYLESPTRLKSTVMPTGIAEGADIRYPCITGRVISLTLRNIYSSL